MDKPKEWPIVLAYQHARALLQAREMGQGEATISLDLNMTTTTVMLETARVVLPGERWLPWTAIGSIASNESACFAVLDDGTIERIGRFSEELQRHYSLFPTAGAPTILIGGFSMHRIKESDPLRDTRSKVRAAAPLRGAVLDTTTGLGYTAIEAARNPQVERVVTIEIDPTTLEIARYNPWSRALFTDPKISQLLGDANEIVQTLPTGSFSRIIHDPPIFGLAGELYSGAFYRELFRLLRRGGRLFHYIGNLERKSGAGVSRGVIRRLQEAGFARVGRRPEAFGIVAEKER